MENASSYFGCTPNPPHPAAVARDREMAERRMFDVITALGHLFGPPTDTAVHEAVVTVLHLRDDAEQTLTRELAETRSQVEQLLQQKAEVVGELVDLQVALTEHVRGLSAGRKPSAIPKYVRDLQSLTASFELRVRRVVRSQG